MTEKRPGPAPGVPLIEVSVKRELTVFSIMNLVVVVVFFQANHHRALMNFVEAQAQYYAQCHAYMAELQKQLARYNATHFFFQCFNSGEGVFAFPRELAEAVGFGS